MSFITSPGIIVPPLTAGGVAYGTGSQAKVNSAGTAGQFLQSAGAGVPIWADGSAVKRVVRTSNTVLATTNNSNLISYTSGTFTQTFDAAATLGNGWYCFLQNSGTGVITLDPNGAELIDGLTSYAMYPGESRLVQCTGTAFFSVVLSPFLATFTSSGTFIVPPGYKSLNVLAWGGGGGGGGGRGFTTLTIRSSGGGAGAGGRNIMLVNGQAAGTSITVTIGAGGPGGAGGALADGDVGTLGGDTSFGSLMSAYGGTYGNGGAQGGTSGGSGGGSLSVGSVFSRGGKPRPATTDLITFADGNTIQNNIGFGGGGNTANTAQVWKMGCTEYGGSGGGLGSTGSQAGVGGADSIFGATGGGGGGGLTSGDSPGGTGAGGGVGYGSVGGGSAGGSNSAGVAGAVLSTGSGGGGGGGSPNATGTGYAGGAGAAPGGGGGGGGAGTTTGGAGGAGGNGQIIVIGVA